MHLPAPFRAVVGLAATAATEAKHLPDRAIELPMLVVSSALQASLRAQQRYARYAARGDEVLNRRTPTEEPPAWATFDEPVSLDELRRTSGAQLGASTVEHVFGVEDPTLDPDGREPVGEIRPSDEPPVTAPVGAPTATVVTADGAATDGTAVDGTGVSSTTDEPGPKAPTAKAPTTKTATAKTATAKTATTKTATAKTATAKAAAAKGAGKKAARKAAARKAGKKKAARKAAADTPAADAFADPAVERAKSVSKPRHTAPSAFDNVTDD